MNALKAQGVGLEKISLNGVTKYIACSITCTLNFEII